MTWNTWWRFVGNWRQRGPGILDVVRRVDPDLLGIQECWGDGQRTQASVIADERMLPSLLLADLNYDRDQPPLAGLTLRDGWEGAEPGADSRTLSSQNRFAPAEAVDQYDRRIDHVAYEPGRAPVRATAAQVIRDEPGGLPPSDHYPVVVDLEILGWSSVDAGTMAAWLSKVSLSGRCGSTSPHAAS